MADDMQARCGSVPLIIERDPDDPDCAMIIVEGTVAARPYRFVLDTGAARTQLVIDDFTSRLSSDAQESSSGVFAPSHNALITVSDLSVGPLLETSLEVVRADQANRGVDSLLGMDVLSSHCCNFQFDRNTLVIEQTPVRQAVNPLQMDERGHFYVDATWPSVTARACWDSGAGISIVDQAFLAKHPDLFEEIGSSTGTDSTGAQAVARTFMIIGLNIAGESFARHKVAAVDLAEPNSTLDQPMDMILGYTTLCQANWLFDFPAKRWAVTRLPEMAPM